MADRLENPEPEKQGRQLPGWVSPGIKLKRSDFRRTKADKIWGLVGGIIFVLIVLFAYVTRNVPRF